MDIRYTGDLTVLCRYTVASQKKLIIKLILCLARFSAPLCGTMATKLFANGVSKHGKTKQTPKEMFEDYPLFEALFTYLCCGILYILAHTAEFFRTIGLRKRYTVKNVSG